VWFADGGVTASGERNEAGALSAAHRTLPFGTRLQVDNLGNGRSVVVRINDRGPFTKGRIISVSRIAAEHLGMTSDGIAQVQLTVIDDQSPQEPCSEAKKAVDARGAALPLEIPLISNDTMAERFATAFRAESWEESELRKAIEAFMPRLIGTLRRGNEPLQLEPSAPELAEAMQPDLPVPAANAKIPWPSLDGLTQVNPSPFHAYLWSTELTIPGSTERFERASATVHLSQLLQ
jgi:rare lipoprotein A